LPLILAVNPSLGVSNMQEFVALAKSKPGELTYASVGVGTVPHLSTQLFSKRTGSKLQHLPYQGNPPAGADPLAGRGSTRRGRAFAHRAAGRSGAAQGAGPEFIRARARRAERADHGRGRAPRFRGRSPAGTPREVIDKLSAAANKALASDDVAAKLRAQGFEPMGGPPDEFAQFHRARNRQMDSRRGGRRAEEIARVCVTAITASRGLARLPSALWGGVKGLSAASQLLRLIASAEGRLALAQSGQLPHAGTARIL